MVRVPRLSFFLCSLLTILLCSTGTSEQLPLRHYSVADGLPGNGITAIRRDSRGFLWFATTEGLSRFDGYEFDNYGRANGLTRDAVYDFLVTRSGLYLAATGDGVFRFDPQGPAGKQFTRYSYRSNSGPLTSTLYEDRSGRIWCGTNDGLFLLGPTGAAGSPWFLQEVSLPRVAPGPIGPVIALFEDNARNLWIGTFSNLYLRAPNGSVRHLMHFSDGERWLGFTQDRQGRIWGGRGTGLWRILSGENDTYRFLPLWVPKKQTFVWQVMEAPDGKLWLATSEGLGLWTPVDDDARGSIRLYGVRNGLAVPDVDFLETDREGNLWLGTEDGGAMRLARSGFVSYGAADGIDENDRTASLFRNRLGDVYPTYRRFFKVLREGRFVTVVPSIPGKIKNFGWAWHQTALQDHTGDWWMATGDGLVRFPNVPIENLAHARSKAVYTSRDGLGTNEIFRLYEDRAGDIWIACIGPHGVNGLSRWKRSTNSLETFRVPVGSVATAFEEDHDGRLWIGFFTGELACVQNGTFRYFRSADGLTGGMIEAIHRDHAGRIWMASSRGLMRVDSPEAQHPAFHRFGVEDGLSSNIIHCITEDQWGRLYVATAKGIDRMDADGRVTPGRIRHFGLAKGIPRDLLMDRAGVLWLASSRGIARMMPELETAQSEPPVFIRTVYVRGIPYPVGNAGRPEPPVLNLAPYQNQLRFEFSGLAFDAGKPLLYQYRLEPADRDWSTPSDQRSVNYTNIAPGRYRFGVRVAAANGPQSEQPATVDFVIRATLWQRSWFRMLMAIAAGGLAYLLHRYRTLRVVELERVRTRIAADLHDDIGSGLSQIAVLSEVARTRINGFEPEMGSVLSNIASVSRDLTQSMQDIVWSINPERDHLTDLVQRMRRFASDVLSAKNIDLQFRFSSGDPQRPLHTEIRREVYLVFKEAVNNLLRHSGCAHVDIEVLVSGDCLELIVEDDGCGLRTHHNGHGHGLKSMCERAHRIGGEIEFQCGERGGLRLHLRVPTRSRILPSGRTRTVLSQTGMFSRHD